MTMTEEQIQQQESRLEKILKLLAKAESTTPEEAEALTEKAQQLMARWAIDDAMLESAQGKLAPDKIIEKTVLLKGIYSKAHMNLAHLVTQQLGCRGFYSTVYGKSDVRWHIVGFESDVARIEMLLASLLVQGAVALKSIQIPSYLSGMEKFKERRYFLFGFANAVSARLAKANREAKEAVVAEQAPAEQDGGKGMELVLLDRKQRVDAWMDEKHGKLRHSSSRMHGGSGSGRSQGHAAGQRADLGGTGIGGSRKAIGR